MSKFQKKLYFENFQKSKLGSGSNFFVKNRIFTQKSNFAKKTNELNNFFKFKISTWDKKF